MKLDDYQLQSSDKTFKWWMSDAGIYHTKFLYEIG